jgi:hypothetical protein
MTPPAEVADLCSPPWDNRFAQAAFILIHGTKHWFVLKNSIFNGVQEPWTSSSNLATRISAERA